jgi:GNAT superfamily N-acetyltransferase
MYARIGLGDETLWRHYLGRWDGVAVATASLFLTGDVGGLYFISTAPAWRRRGIGSAITYAALQAARLAQCRWAVLSASRAGLPIYQRLGMADVCRFDLYKWTPRPSDQ